MIEIALCDDNKEDIELIKSFAERFAAENTEFPIRLSTFDSAEELIKAFGENRGFDLYMLDVMLPGMSGIQLAEKYGAMTTGRRLFF